MVTEQLAQLWLGLSALVLFVSGLGLGAYAHAAYTEEKQKVTEIKVPPLSKALS